VQSEQVLLHLISQNIQICTSEQIANSKMNAAEEEVWGSKSPCPNNSVEMLADTPQLCVPDYGPLGKNVSVQHPIGCNSN